jgi:hypothetical protein
MIEALPTVDLATLELKDLGLIIQSKTGVIFTNQVGGLGCLHPEAQGVFIPLSVGHKKILLALTQHFRGDWNHINERDADFIDRLLRSDGFEFIKVDRSRLKDSFEAWIYVNVENSDEEFPAIKGFGESKGILTWQNSD